jgi:uncharacterized protein YndB with AHSA1/START domain
MDSAATTGDRVITITHTYDAPRELVFRAWIEPEHLVRWYYASEGWTTPFAETDPRPGGAFRIGFASPDGADDFVFEGVYNEVVESERIVFTIGDGRPVWVTFADDGGWTKLTLELTLENENSEELQRTGWGAMIEQLGEHLASIAAGEVLLVTRTFDAPRALVFKAWTEPERLAQWWGAKGSTVHVSRLDLRPGGDLLYSMRMPNSDDIWGKFVYRKIEPPARLVWVYAFSDADGNLARNPWMPDYPLEVLNTLTLNERDGKTTLSLLARPINATEPERATFEAAVASMQQGFKGTMDELAAYLASA